MVMAYGTPSASDDLAAYYTHIRRGRPPTTDQLDDLRRRYDAIGGLSPLREITAAQARGIAEQLEVRAPGRFKVTLGLKHAAPFIEDAAVELRDCEVIVGLVLAPHFSHLSVGGYLDRLEAAAPWATTRRIASWWAHPDVVAAQANRLRRALAATQAGSDTLVLFTAHSLPARVLETDDPYVDELTRSATAIAQASGVPNWALAWQSAGRTPEPWLGPDIGDVLRALAGSVDEVLVCPQGFTADHLEVLYDLDIEATLIARDNAISLTRTTSLNDDATVMAALADLVEAAI